MMWLTLAWDALAHPITFLENTAFNYLFIWIPLALLIAAGGYIAERRRRGRDGL